MKGHIVFYTAIANSYDYLRPIPSGFCGIDFYCFTDEGSPKNSKHGWQFRRLPAVTEDPVKNCRFVKHNPHRFFVDYEFSVWIDANIQIKQASLQLIQSLLEARVSFAAFGHPQRSCAYEEAEICLQLRKDSPVAIEKTIRFLKKQKYPKNRGLIETGMLFRRHAHPKIISSMEAWSALVQRGSSRDQLTINYILDRFGVPIYTIPGFLTLKNLYFTYGPHKTRGARNLVPLLSAYAYTNSLSKFIFSLTILLLKLKNEILRMLFQNNRK